MWRCSKCNKEVSDNLNYCYDCGAKRGAAISYENDSQQVQHNSNKYKSAERNRYNTLNNLISISKLCGWISLILHILVAYSLSQVVDGSKNIGNGLIVAALITGIISLVLLYALAEGIKVFLDIETSTRESKENSQLLIHLQTETNQLLRKIANHNIDKSTD